MELRTIKFALETVNSEKYKGTHELSKDHERGLK